MPALDESKHHTPFAMLGAQCGQDSVCRIVELMAPLTRRILWDCVARGVDDEPQTADFM
jgi:hypothetical protein